MDKNKFINKNVSYNCSTKIPTKISILLSMTDYNSINCHSISALFLGTAYAVTNISWYPGIHSENWSPKNYALLPQLVSFKKLWQILCVMQREQNLGNFTTTECQFEHRSLSSLGKCSTTWATTPTNPFWFRLFFRKDLTFCLEPAKDHYPLTYTTTDDFTPFWFLLLLLLQCHF
jgi:hypothetical protein